MAGSMHTGGPLPVARFFQALLEDWTLTDASGVINTVTDGAGFCDILTTATSGTAYFTLPIKNYLGASVGVATNDRTFGAMFLSKAISGSLVLDRYLVGLSDNVDPTAGGALWEGCGVRHSATPGFFAAGAGNETTPIIASSSFAFTGDPTVISDMQRHKQRTQHHSNAYIWDTSGPTFKGFRQLTVARDFDPTHVVLAFHQSAATIATHRIGIGYFIGPSIPDLSITSRTP